MRARLLVALLIAVVGSVLTGPTTASAADDTDVSWSLVPAAASGPDGRVSFRYAVDPGDAFSDHFTVTNSGGQRATFALYASDGMTTDKGVFDLLPVGEQPTDSGTWVTLKRKRVVLDPGESTTVAFSVAVPADATPGDHPAGIVAALTTDGDTPITVERRVGARVHFRVSGPLTPRLAVKGISTSYDGSWARNARGGLVVEFDVVNTGNLRLTGRVALQVTGPFDRWRRSMQLGSLPEILPGYQVHLRSELADVPAMAMMTASVQVVPLPVGDDVIDAELPQTRGGARIWTMPWLWVVVLLVLVAMLTGLVLNRGRQRRRIAAAVAVERRRTEEALSRTGTDRE